MATTGGTGGGGDSVNGNTGEAGAANTGGGGGCCHGSNETAGDSGNGGSGVVIIRWRTI